MQASFKAMAQRIANAENSFVRSIQEQFGKTKADAERILSVLRKYKIVKRHGYDLRVIHGAYWDQDVMDRALKAFDK